MTATTHDTTTVPDAWYRDAASCLHATLGVVAAAAGGDPLDVCGAAWAFRHLPGDVRGEEFYWPAADRTDPVADLAPFHPLRSRWRRAGGEDPLAELAAAVGRGTLPVAAVDNFYLPFRPAFGDVHAAHLVVVSGIDDEHVHVCDPVPPGHRGPVPRADFLRAWSSANPADAQDRFFSSSPLDRRWLEVTAEAAPVALDPPRLAAALRRNLRGFSTGGGPGWSGRAGLDRWIEALTAHRTDPAALAETYVFGWCMQAQAALHGELLRRRGAQWAIPVLAEAGRRVERVAAAWTPVRVGAAHAATHGDPVPALPGHLAALRRAYDQALDAVATAVAVMDGGPS